MGVRKKIEYTGSLKYSGKGKIGYMILVPLQDISYSKTLLPPAIRAAKRHNGKIILFNVIEIPYQLAPSEAEQYIMERESKLEYARQIIEKEGCDVEIMVRIAHRMPYAIEHFAGSLNIDLIVMWARNSESLWNNEIYQKLYDVNSNMLVAMKQVETYFDEVIIQVDDLQAASSMIEHATYLLRSEDGTIHLIPVFGENDERSTLRTLRSIVNNFKRQNSWFDGKTIVNQLQPKSATKQYLNDMYDKSPGSIGLLISYPTGKKSGADTWLKDEAEKLNLPVFLSKVGPVEPVGIDQLTDKLKIWLGITS